MSGLRGAQLYRQELRKSGGGAGSLQQGLLDGSRSVGANAQAGSSTPHLSFDPIGAPHNLGAAHLGDEYR